MFSIPLVPIGLRSKTYNSQISREIFFLDCINDLAKCYESNNSYHLIRSSVLLRMLIIDDGIGKISKNYRVKMSFAVNSKDLDGNPLSTRNLQDLPNKMMQFSKTVPTYYKLDLIGAPIQQLKLDKFRKKICISIKTVDNAINFSVDNIIKLVANNHGAAHLESSFEASEFESFHWNDFNPLSLTNNSQYIKRLKEIIYIMIEGLKPLIQKVYQNLVIHNKRFFQSSTSMFVKGITKDEFETNPEKFIVNKKDNPLI